MQNIGAQRRRRVWPAFVSLALLALAWLSTAGSLAEPDVPSEYAVYLPFAGKPPPTPTHTPTPTPTPAPPDIRVDPACSHFQGGSTADPTGEYVCFRSYDERPTVMTGWLVKDRTGLRYTFPTFALDPGATVRLHSGDGQNTATDLYTGKSRIWNDGGDTVYLYDASGNEVTTYVY